MEVGTGATPTECKDASEDVAKGSNGAGSTAIKSFGVVSSMTAGVTTYTLTAFSDAVGASDACATGGTKSTVTSVINACQFVGYSVDANGAFAVYAVLSDINTANSAKIVGAVFYNEETCTTPIDATPVPVDFTITTVQALSSNVLYGQLASTTAPFVFYTTSDSAGTTPFTVSYQTNLCQDVSSLSLTTKSVQFYLNFETGDVYAVGFTKVTCTDDDTNEAGASYPINLQLDTETTLTCQQVASDLYAKN